MLKQVINQEQTFLIELLRAIYQNHEVYPILQNNLNKLNENLALILRKWVSDRFTKEPANTVSIARVIFKLSTIIQGFDQGNPASNLEIAIAGFETVQQVFTRQAFPQECDIIQQALITAYQQRQQILSKNINEIRDQTVQTQTQVYTLTENFQQQLEQAKLQVNDLKTVITQLKQEVESYKPTQEITSLIAELRELKQQQSNLYQLATTANYLPKANHLNTAIFYDIENLPLGKSNPNFLNYSLKQIIASIETFNSVNKIALQCAYADWSDSRLRLLKNEIQELGIEAIQIFDYSHKRNAADMQLAIDVMELAQSRPTLQVFVIVSGDGAFASLAKKLHEYGKTVVGCAYEGNVNRILKSVCDRFIPIPVPAPQVIIEEIPVTEVIDNSRLNDEILLITNQALQELKQNSEQAIQLKQGGIIVPLIHTFLKHKITNFDQRREKHGSKLTSFLNKVLAQTDIGLSIENNKLILRETLTTNSNKLSNMSQEAITQSQSSSKEVAVAGKS